MAKNRCHASLGPRRVNGLVSRCWKKTVHQFSTSSTEIQNVFQIPNLSFAADAHYHHLADDIIQGGKFTYEGGSIEVPEGPGLGVKLNREKVLQYSELYQRLGSYPYDQDPLRPEWAPTIPNNRWADPLDDRSPLIDDFVGRRVLRPPF